MPKQRFAALLLSAALLSACTSEPEDTTVGEPLPDTFPVTGTSSDLPEGMPLPPTPEDTLPQ
jgi:hypothetical protein